MSFPSPDAKAVVRALEDLTTQVRRLADTRQSDFVLTADVTDDDATTGDDDALRRMLTDALTAEHYRRAREQIVASPEEHSAGMADVAMRIIGVYRAAEAMTPAAECSAQHHGDGYRTECIRAAQHPGVHVDTKGFSWPDWSAVYPTDSTVKVGPPLPRPAKFEDERAVREHEAAALHRQGLLSDSEVNAVFATADDEAVAPTCWHTEAGSPCDWDCCLQPERLAAGDQGVDPATTPPLGPKLRAMAEQQATAVDEEPSSGERRKSLAVLLSRAQRSVTPLTSEESGLLRRHVETEIREANTARAVARSNLRHVQALVPELTAAQAAIGRVRAECKAIAHEVYGQHDEDDDGKREAVGRVIAALDGTKQPTDGDDPEALRAKVDEATATLRRVRAVVRAWGQRTLARSEVNRLWTEVRDALAGPHPDPKQPTTEA